MSNLYLIYKKLKETNKDTIYLYLKLEFLYCTLQIVTYLTGDEAVKRIEFLRKKWEMDRISEINHAKEVGKIEGKIEEKKETAKKLLEQGVDIEIVIKATGLSREEIKEIIAEKDNSN